MISSKSDRGRIFSGPFMGSYRCSVNVVWCLVGLSALNNGQYRATTTKGIAELLGLKSRQGVSKAVKLGESDGLLIVYRNKKGNRKEGLLIQLSDLAKCKVKEFSHGKNLSFL